MSVQQCRCREGCSTGSQQHRQRPQHNTTIYMVVRPPRAGARPARAGHPRGDARTATQARARTCAPLAHSANTYIVLTRSRRERCAAARRRTRARCVRARRVRCARRTTRVRGAHTRTTYIYVVLVGAMCILGEGAMFPPLLLLLLMLMADSVPVLYRCPGHARLPVGLLMPMLHADCTPKNATVAS